MPPKVKHTREEILQTALELAREQGPAAVTAREIGKRLGTSSTPVFTAFKNMEELFLELRKAAMKEFDEYARDAIKYKPAFKQIGVQMIRFAMERPQLFQLIYMQEYKESQSYDDMIKSLGDMADVCRKIIEKDYGLSPKEADVMFRQIWVHTFGICVLCASKVCSFTEEELDEMMSREFMATMLLIKSGRMDQCVVKPEREQSS